MKPLILGILTYRKGARFTEPLYFRSLMREGRKMGIRVFLFSHEDVDAESRQIRGYIHEQGAWTTRRFPWPDIVIDRRRSHWSPEFRQMRNKDWFVYANRKFVAKHEATALFARTQSLQRWIPKTVMYSRENLRRMLREFPEIYVKPGNGTGGSGVVKLARKGSGYTALCRERRFQLRRQKKLDSVEAAANYLDRWIRTQSIRSGRFIVQQGLDLALIPGRVTDSRLLIQKDGEGKWSVTGMAVRVGEKGSPTTNLIRSKGRAYSFDAFMTDRFGAEKTAKIKEECGRMAREIVRVVEARFGPMLEFGMDVGIDVNGRVWLIEANPKPSREVFLKSGDSGLFLESVRKPLGYALFLSRQSRRANDRA